MFTEKQTHALVAAKLKKSLKIPLKSVPRLLVHVVEWAQFNKYYFMWDAATGAKSFINVAITCSFSRSHYVDNDAHPPVSLTAKFGHIYTPSQNITIWP